MPDASAPLYIGIDVGGTNIGGALVAGDGRILTRLRQDTPQRGTPKEIIGAISKTIAGLLKSEAAGSGEVAAIGLGVPGLVDPDDGSVLVAPNVGKGLSGQQLVDPIEQAFGIATLLGNDVNVGVMGECWLGAARGLRHAVGIFVGTGIGGGIVSDGRLLTGANHAAGEIGHMIMQPGGPECGCGNRGCLEALASRTAIERRIREAVRSGEKTILTELLDGGLERIRSKALKRALKEQDPLVTGIMKDAARLLGLACISVQHLLAPEAIVLGGGVIEACGDFLLPIATEVFAADPLSLPGVKGRLLRSALGDDAGVLGAVALAKTYVENGVDREGPAQEPEIAYPPVGAVKRGEVAVGDRRYATDICIRADGEVRKRKKAVIKKKYGTSHVIGREEVKKACKGGARTLVIGIGLEGRAALDDAAQKFLGERGIVCRLVNSGEAGAEFNRTAGRKALLLHVKC